MTSDAAQGSDQIYRMIALDVDGTIARKDYSVPPEIRNAILEAMDAGVIVSLVTGRMRRSALRYAELCGTNGPTVSYQGGIVTASDHQTDLHVERLDDATVQSALQVMRDWSVHINFYLDDEIWVENDTLWAHQYAQRMQIPLKRVDGLDSLAASGPTVVMAVDDPDRITELATSLRGSLGGQAAITQSLPHFCEVASLRATKAHGLERAASLHGISPEEVIAIGDGEGDIPMLEWAGLGIAIAGSGPEVLSSAQTMIPGPEENGVSKLIQTLLSQGKLGRQVR